MHVCVFCVWVHVYWHANTSASVCKAEINAHLFNEVGSLTGPANYLTSLVRDKIRKANLQGDQRAKRVANL